MATRLARARSETHGRVPGSIDSGILEKSHDEQLRSLADHIRQFEEQDAEDDDETATDYTRTRGSISASPHANRYAPRGLSVPVASGVDAELPFLPSGFNEMVMTMLVYNTLRQLKTVGERLSKIEEGLREVVQKMPENDFFRQCLEQLQNDIQTAESLKTTHEQFISEMTSKDANMAFRIAQLENLMDSQGKEMKREIETEMAPITRMITEHENRLQEMCKTSKILVEGLEKLEKDNEKSAKSLGGPSKTEVDLRSRMEKIETSLATYTTRRIQVEETTAGFDQAATNTGKVLAPLQTGAIIQKKRKGTYNTEEEVSPYFGSMHNSKAGQRYSTIPESPKSMETDGSPVQKRRKVAQRTAKKDNSSVESRQKAAEAPKTSRPVEQSRAMAQDGANKKRRNATPKTAGGNGPHHDQKPKGDQIRPAQHPRRSSSVGSSPPSKAADGEASVAGSESEGASLSAEQKVSSPVKGLAYRWTKYTGECMNRYHHEEKANRGLTDDEKIWDYLDNIPDAESKQIMQDKMLKAFPKRLRRASGTESKPWRNIELDGLTWKHMRFFFTRITHDDFVL